MLIPACKGHLKQVEKRLKWAFLPIGGPIGGPNGGPNACFCFIVLEPEKSKKNDKYVLLGYVDTPIMQRALI